MTLSGVSLLAPSAPDLPERGTVASAIRAWLVDLDGTLYHALPVRLCMAAELVLCGRAWIGPIRCFRKLHEQLRQQADSEARNQEAPDPYQRQVLLAAHRLGQEPQALAAALEEWMQQRPGKWLRLFRRRRLLRQIAAFRQRGGRTALVSDYPARVKLAALKAQSLFDVIVASGEEGGPPRLKPAPDGYLLAARRLGVPPEACLVLGDRDDTDGEAARRAGMRFRPVGWG